jgi:hypothetical protein
MMGTSMAQYDTSKLIRIEFFFRSFTVPSRGQPLVSANLQADTEVILFERGPERRTLLASEMAYHHVAQGELAGEPYLVSF